MSIVIGTAGWTIPREAAGAFPAAGASLERYAAMLRGAEINSSFHRPHRLSTWRRWGESVPDDFRFSVKLPRTISHQRRLAGCGEEVARFLEEAGELGDKLAILLLQLPPSFAFDAALAEDFLAGLAPRTPARLAVEPRHPSWFEPEADALLRRLETARVAADPAVVPAAAEPGGWQGLAYWRLHGSPVMYRSSYDEARLDAWAKAVREAAKAGAETWCIFDNTASAAAMGNALRMVERVSGAIDPRWHRRTQVSAYDNACASTLTKPPLLQIQVARAASSDNLRRMESKTATAIGAGILTVITPLVFPAISLPLGLAFYGVAGGLFAYAGRDVIRQRAGRLLGASDANVVAATPSRCLPFPPAGGTPAVELTDYLAGRLIAQPISTKTLHVLRFIAENETPEFYLEAAVNAVPRANTYMDLRGAWAGLTRRTRKLLNNREALLIHWREEYDAKGNWVDWVGAVSHMTHRSLRKQFGLEKTAGT